MELYQLRTFVTVAREGNLTRAAERLFTSQPAVSAHIKALEEEFGLKLFERTPGGMVPTTAGETLWDEAERLLHTASDLAGRAASLKGRVAGLLRLGLNNEIGVLRSSGLLAQLATEHADLRFEIVYGTSGALLQAVTNREIDAGFHEGAVNDPTMASLPLTEFELVIAVPPAWLAELDRPDWSALEARPWVVGTPTCSFQPFMHEIERTHGLRLNQRFVLNDDATALHLVASGLAVALTTRETIEATAGARGEVAIWPHFRRPLPLSLCYLKNRAGDPLIRELVRVTRLAWAQPAAALA